MKNSKLVINNLYTFFCALLFAFCVVPIDAQSTSVDYPTPITSSEISGKIPARDIGDARLTSYYYVFNGTQGDVFINVESANFNGDIDIFSAQGLRPLSKIRLFADQGNTETGRIVYLRQPDRLILKIEGRTPDDSPATFRIKFAGSFAAVEGSEKTDEPALPEIKSSADNAVRVNSVGTIIEQKAEVKPAEENKAAENRKSEKTDDEAKSEVSKVEKKETPNLVIPEKNKETLPASDNEEISKVEKVAPKSKSSVKRKSPVKKFPAPVKIETAEQVKTQPEEVKPTPVNPLENVRLIVLMKSGDRFEYPMTEVFRFSLNNNVLTIILKDGKIERRSILDIQKFSVE